MEPFDNRVNQVINTKLSSMTNMETGNHAHNGYDVNAIDPAVGLLGFPVYQVTDATVAPTDVPQNGTFRYQVDTTPRYVLWTYLNYLNASTVIVGAWRALSLNSTALLTTKGDLFTFSTTNTRLGVGANATYLVADSTQATGLKWLAVGNTNGTSTKDASDASTTQSFVHGLSTTPTKVTIEATCVFSSANVQWVRAYTTYNGTTQSSQSVYINGATTTVADNSFTLNINTAAGTQRGVVTFDATNITITWTKTGTASGVYQLLWTATNN